jgi:hypothetical protein
MRKLFLLMAVCFGLAAVFLQTSSAQAPQAAPGEVPPGSSLSWVPGSPAPQAAPAPGQVPPGYRPAEPYGYGVKRPVLATVCHFCPWGVIGDYVIAAMKPYGWDVQGCFSCNSMLITLRKEIPPRLRYEQIEHVSTPLPPYAPPDFSSTGGERGLYEAYHGLGQYKEGGPYKNIRLVAKIEGASYFVVAVRAETGITDLAQIKAKRMPVNIYSSGAGAKVLEYYGLTKEELESWGASVGAPAPWLQRPGPPNPGGHQRRMPEFDVYLYNAIQANNPENNLILQESQKHILNFLQLPEDLLDKLVEWPAERVVMPQAYFAGVDRPIKTFGGGGVCVWVRDDAPDNFTYDLAKALDKHKMLLKGQVIPYYYNSETVASVRDVPLAPGAARYYREVGYIK